MNSLNNTSYPAQCVYTVYIGQAETPLYPSPNKHRAIQKILGVVSYTSN